MVPFSSASDEKLTGEISLYPPIPPLLPVEAARVAAMVIGFIGIAAKKSCPIIEYRSSKSLCIYTVAAH